MVKTAVVYILVLLLAPSMVFARTEVNENGEVEARKYFTKNSREPQSTKAESPSPVGEDEHYLAIHLGSFLSSDSYQWVKPI